MARIFSANTPIAAPEKNEPNEMKTIRGEINGNYNERENLRTFDYTVSMYSIQHFNYLERSTVRIVCRRRAMNESARANGTRASLYLEV